jgi:hypothetical protein
MFFNLTLNSAVWLLIGLSSMAYGGYVGYRMRMFIYALGLLSLGFGCICCGLTNGFTDQSPKTRLLRKFGKFALIVGLPLTGYYFYLIMYNS